MKSHARFLANAAWVGAALLPSMALPQVSFAQSSPTPSASADSPSSPSDLAQASTPSDDKAQGADKAGDIVVTGTYIRGSAESAALPVDVIGGKELANRGAPTILDLLKSLPSSSGVLGDTNQFDSRANGAEGTGSVNLRALGAERTLVLLNGKRLAFNPVPATNGGTVDTNLIPASAIARVEVLKDGAAATYGSDAIAGVVNFITRENQKGFAVAADYRFISGSDGDWTASASWGGQIGKLKIFLSGGYQHRSQLEAFDRAFVRKTYLQNPNGGYTAVGNPGSYIPLNAAFTALGSARRDVNCTALNGFAGFSGATPVCYAQSVQFDNLVDEESRYQVFGSASYAFSKAAEFYVEGLYSRTDSPRVITSPSQSPAQLPSVDPTGVSALAGRFYVPASNPGFQSYLTANPGAFPVGTTGVQLVSFRPFFLGGNPLYQNTGGGEGSRRYRAYRISAGLRGDLGSSINYDVSATYMEDSAFNRTNDVMIDRLQLALVGLGGANCDGNPSQPGIQGTPGVGGCQYFNPFSTAVALNAQQGGVNSQYNPAVANDPALASWFYKDFTYRYKSTLFVVDGVVNGKLGLRLPGGDIGWALGGQYRSSTYRATSSDNINVNITPCLATPDFGVTNCSLRNGAFGLYNAVAPASVSGDVYAFFGELSIPLFDKLSFQAAARYENYGGNIGSTFNPKFAGKWSVTSWFALRGSISTTFRGPPLISTDTNPRTTLQNIRGIFRAVDNYGSPNLKPEKATAFNVGALVDTGGLHASVDFFKFKLRQSITVEPIASIAAALYPTNTTNRCSDPAYAAVLARFTFQDLNGNGTADDCAAANIARVRVNTINGSPVTTSGLDFAASYTVRDIAGIQATIGGDATMTIEYKISALSLGSIPLAAAFDAVGKLNYQTVAYPLPRWKGSAYLNLDAGKQNLRVTMRYVGKYVDQRTDIYSPSVNYSTNGTAVTLAQGKNIGSWTVFDVSYRVGLPEQIELSATIENLFDRDPPFVRLNYSYDPFVANGLGTTLKFGVSKKF